MLATIIPIGIFIVLVIGIVGANYMM
jgi:hypothetical protein